MNPIFVYFLVINSLSFSIFGIDKALAVAKKNRISEMTLLASALIGGTLGGLIAMPLFRHKISKTSFLVKFFGVVVLQLLVIGIFLKTLPSTSSGTVISTNIYKIYSVIK